MRAAVHPDGALHAPGVTANANRDNLLGDRVFLRPDAHRKARAAEQIIGAMRNALPLGDGLRGGFPTIGLQPCGVVDGKAEVIAEFGSGKALQIIPGITAAPFAGEIHLRERRRTRHGDEYPNEEAHAKSAYRTRYRATPRPQRRAVAISAPWRNALSFNQTTGSITYSRLVKVPKPQSALAMTRSRSPAAATASSKRRATTSGCSTMLLLLSTTPGSSSM